MRAVISNEKAPLPLPDPPLKGEGGQEQQRREEDAP